MSNNPYEELQNSDPVLLESVESIEKKYPGKTVGEVVASTLMFRVGLSNVSASEMGARVDNLVLGLRNEGTHKEVSDTRLSAAVTELLSLVRINFAYDLDYLASYSKAGPTVIYIDRGIQRFHTLPPGKPVDVVRYLAVHEAVEKSLLDELQFETRNYIRSHQIAQRIEQAAAEAEGVSWSEYQGVFMEAEIARAGAKASTLKCTPPDLDVSPLRDINDPDWTVEEREQFWRKSRSRSVGAKATDVENLFSVHLYGERVFHLKFHDPRRMATAMMRFQEYYESPRFKGARFTSEELNTWFRERSGGASYEDEWGGEGFNVPSYVFAPFYEGHFAPLSEDEMTILDFFSDQGAYRFYVIATAEGVKRDHLSHELAHALYYLDADYKEGVDAILKKVDVKPVREFLSTHKDYACYHPSVLDDETHAYLSQTSIELKERGFDLTPYKDAIRELQELYRRHKKRL